MARDVWIIERPYADGRPIYWKKGGELSDGHHNAFDPRWTFYRDKAQEFDRADHALIVAEYAGVATIRVKHEVVEP